MLQCESSGVVITKEISKHLSGRNASPAPMMKKMSRYDQKRRGAFVAPVGSYVRTRKTPGLEDSASIAYLRGASE